MNKFLRKIRIIIVFGIVFVIAILCISSIVFQNSLYLLKSEIEVERIFSAYDKNNNGIDDTEDILIGARKEVENKTCYKSTYYAGGYPPANEGVCTDVLWRALKYAGYNLKILIDKDIKENTKDYSDSVSKPDPNIDFRRVKNQLVFLKV